MNMKSLLLLIAAIALAAAMIAPGFNSGKNEVDKKIDNKNKEAVIAETPAATETPKTPLEPKKEEKSISGIVINDSMVPPPTPMPKVIIDKPEVSMIAPAGVKPGEKFELVLNLNLPEKSKKIIGVESNLNFDGSLIKADSVQLVNAEPEPYLSMEGKIENNGIKNIAVVNGSGISGTFAVISFTAVSHGTAVIEGKFMAVDETEATAVVVASKTVEIIKG